MNSPEFGLKELYDVSLKLTLPIEVEGRVLEAGETIAVFDKIQLLTADEIRSLFTAHGGFDDAPRVYWSETKGVNLQFTQGIFSKTQLALMSNARLVKTSNQEFHVNERESIESDEEGIIELAHEVLTPLFIYNTQNGEKITNYTVIDGTHVNIGTPYLNVLADYWYNYNNGFTCLQIGQTLTNGFLQLVAKTNVQDDITGKIRTGILQIPKLKLMSDLSIRLGKNASPQVGKLNAVALPIGGHDDKRIMDLVFLNDDIDSDI